MMGASFHAPGVLAAAWLLDLGVGEPPALLHPVVWMGKAIQPFKRALGLGRARELAAGVLALLCVAGGFGLATFLLLRALSGLPLLCFAVEVYLLWSAFALRGLLRAARVMQQAIEAHDLGAARAALTSLCSRDPSALDESELLGATVESITENTSDSVVAPLFYFALLGVPGALFYRAVNTLDAMIGYRGRFEYLGKASARLDDLLNFVPARVTAFFMWCSGGLMGLSLSRAQSVFLRDRNHTESPNAGQVMAMASGLLGLRLDKRDHYVLGEGLRAPDARGLSRALKLVELSGWLCFVVLTTTLVLWGVKHDLAG
jgi:adenosylcobinamide-phosphate synthase